MSLKGLVKKACIILNIKPQRFGIVCFILIALCLLSFSNRDSIAQSGSKYVPGYFEDLSSTDVYLLTVAPKSEPHRMFGHTIIRVVDRARNVDLAVNWGIFDFKDPGFLLKFLRGNLYYSVEAYSFKSQLLFWQKDGCLVYQDKLNLTLKQKQVLLKKIFWNLRDDNKYFIYSYFRQNCATYPRDYIDEALGGYLKQNLDIPSNISLRKDSLENLAINPFTYLGVDLIFNSQTDSLVSVWDLLYKPSSLKEALSSLKAIDDRGVKTDQDLLVEHEVLVEGSASKRMSVDGYLFVQSFFVLFLIFLVVFRSSKYYPPILGWMGCCYGLMSFFIGLMLSFFWFASYQTDCMHNVNLFMFLPTDFLVIIFSVFCILNKPVFTSWIKYYFILHILLWGVETIGVVLGIIEQDVSRVLLYGSAIHIIIYILLLKESRKQSVLRN